MHIRLLDYKELWSETKYEIDYRSVITWIRTLNPEESALLIRRQVPLRREDL